jgi:antitoxin component YwqK of YwqJK toxin-antitoxin module
MKLKSSILSEGKVKFDYRNGKVEFNTSIKNGNIILLPKTSKDLDTITHIKTQLGN